MKRTEIVICMGSSCFSRGNGRNYEVIQEYLKQGISDFEVVIRGCRCGGQCMNGPNIWIDGVLHTNIDRGSVIDILEHTLNEKLGENNAVS